MLSHDEYLQKLVDSFKLINDNKLVYLINREFSVIYMSELMLGILNKRLEDNSLRHGNENRVMICIQTPYINNDQVVAIGLQGKHIDIPLDIYSILINS